MKHGATVHGAHMGGRNNRGVRSDVSGLRGDLDGGARARVTEVGIIGRCLSVGLRGSGGGSGGGSGCANAARVAKSPSESMNLAVGLFITDLHTCMQPMLK